MAGGNDIKCVTIRRDNEQDRVRSELISAPWIMAATPCLGGSPRRRLRHTIKEGRAGSWYQRHLREVHGAGRQFQHMKASQLEASMPIRPFWLGLRDLQLPVT